ncbi:hypothetical protein IAD21_00910 [Abditibacteriota bacterium]|nr:hypothetical protein IAD21_00910 [Abditibacteriota bacterium]
MIQGLKVTIPGAELRQLCEARATHHKERQAVYEQQIASMEENKVEGMNYSGGDPVRALKEKREQHQQLADEMAFTATHVDVNESYLLDRGDLERIGVITQGRYY